MSAPAAAGAPGHATGPVRAERTEPGGHGGSRPPLPSLTGLRWLAALLVFGLHIDLAGYFGGRGGKVASWAFASGDTGVSFFFILSGFILMWSARPQDRATRFWRRRIARIYPVHLVTAGLALLMAYTVMPYMKPTGQETVANLLLVHSWTYSWRETLNPVSWSLACEAFFYALFPLIAFLLRHSSARAAAAIAGLSALAAVFMPFVNTQFGLGWNDYYYPPARLPEFVLGVALARLMLLDRWRGPGLKTSLAITVVGYFLAPELGGDHHAVGPLLGFALLIPAAARADLTGAASLWRRPVLVRLGELSFAFYMIHLLAIRFGERLFHAYSPRLPVLSALGATAAALAASLALSWLLYAGVERPGRRLLLLRGRRSPADSPATAARADRSRG
ncbi:acyltransferase [Streptomyces sp. RB6PN25]|uniref:Acyltransferase n=1 Tax=Streptomyces humicola TaxID=2953240 RepID=A0ABT1Q1Z7_9ACTN|nr:acyltransferase [Streptomyces humicola]MCQ4083957.1 acyltransferase [Streptomyces humicola]